MTTLRRLELSTTWADVSIIGGSRAGEGTLILLPQVRLALDPGRPHRALPPMSSVLVSHGHVDHLGGLAYWASQRFLNSMGDGTVLAPREIADGVTRLLQLHAALEGGRPYPVRVVPVEAGVRHRLRPEMELELFATDHWVPTLGGRLLWRKRHLDPALRGLSQEEVARRARAGEAVSEEIEVPVLAYCADTGPQLFAANPEVLSAEIVLLECSFFRPGDRERARRYGHLHVADIEAAAELLGCRHLVLLHASRRHRLREVEALVADLGDRLSMDVHHLMVDWD